MRPLVVLVVCVGCGSAPAGSCEVTTTQSLGYGYCINYIGAHYDANSVKAACEANQSTYSNTTCMSTGVGRCQFQTGTPDEFAHVYDTAAADGGTVDLERICSGNGGTFSAM